MFKDLRLRNEIKVRMMFGLEFVLVYRFENWETLIWCTQFRVLHEYNYEETIKIKLGHC